MDACSGDVISRFSDGEKVTLVIGIQSGILLVLVHTMTQAWNAMFLRERERERGEREKKRRERAGRE